MHKILEKTTIYNGYLKLYRYIVSYRSFEGGWLENVSRDLVENGEAVVVLPYDPKRDAMVTTEQFRIGAMAAGKNPWVMGFVAGMMHAGETEEDVGRREAEEEIGRKIGRMMKIADFMPSPGISSEVVHVYVGEVDSSDADGICGLAGEHDNIPVKAMPASAAFSLLEKGGFTPARAA